MPEVRKEGQTQGDVFLPVRLKFWDRDTIIIMSLADKGGALMESAQIQGTEGQKVYAIEDGELVFDPDKKMAFLMAADATYGLRRWQYMNVKKTPGATEGFVRAGDEIGQTDGFDLVFMVFTPDSPVIALSETESQQLPLNPIPELDLLNVMPLPADMDKILTMKERKELTERLTDEKTPLSANAKIAIGVAGGVLVGALVLKALSK